MATRKTIDRNIVVNTINDFLLNSADDKKQERIALYVQLEEILMRSMTYKGYGIISTEGMKKSKEGHTPGILDFDMPDDKKFIGCDDSRRFYY